MRRSIIRGSRLFYLYKVYFDWNHAISAAKRIKRFSRKHYWIEPREGGYGLYLTR